MTINKRLSIILPSFNDPRIERAIHSIRLFDDIKTVRIVVIDGGSTKEIRNLIKNCIHNDDIFISEPDKGIFDALNKGLELCNTEFIGWLGSDDMFTGKVTASQVVSTLDECDLFVADLYFFQNERVTRKTHALPSRLGLMKLGLHNPHYATFGSTALLKSEHFDIGLRGSDIEYFLKIFKKKPRIKTLNVVATLQEEGGFSNSTYVDILRTNLEMLKYFGVLGPVAVTIKLTYKFLSRMYFKIIPVYVS